MSEETVNDTRRKAAAPFILFTVFLDMLSIGIMIPILPRLIEGFVGSVSAAGWWSGLFGMLWGLTQFFVSPIQGGLSDRYGRRPVVLASNLGSGIDYFLMALAPNLWWLLIGRIVSGMTAASVSTAYAYMSDVTPPEGRAKVFGLMGAAFGLGFVIGPGVGGLLGHFDPRYPFFLAGALSLLNFAYGYFVLPESLPKDKRKAFSFHTSNPWGAVKFLARSKEVFRLSLMSLTLNFAHHSLQTTFVLYAGYRFGWGPLNVGLCLMGVGVMMGVVQAVLTGKIVKQLGEKKTMMLGLACGVVGFIGYGLAPNWMIFIAFAPIQVGHSHAIDSGTDDLKGRSARAGHASGGEHEPVVAGGRHRTYGFRRGLFKRHPTGTAYDLVRRSVLLVGRVSGDQPVYRRRGQAVAQARCGTLSGCGCGASGALICFGGLP
jgi:MFS transporter, DHA1 family, tetracycline resistance protein